MQPNLKMMQESICADAASFDLPSWLLTACISEAKNCIDLSSKRREDSTDKSQNPDDFAILRGKPNWSIFSIECLPNLPFLINTIPVHNLYTSNILFRATWLSKD